MSNIGTEVGVGIVGTAAAAAVARAAAAVETAATAAAVKIAVSALTGGTSLRATPVATGSTTGILRTTAAGK